MSPKRPEHQGPPELYYNEDEASKYTNCARMIEVQESLSERAVELLALPDDGKRPLILDLGCGSGLSGQVLTKRGYTWFGLDISKPMLDVALLRSSAASDDDSMDSDSSSNASCASDMPEGSGHLVLADFGNGIPLRAGSIDGVISISALQWLCHSSHAKDRPRTRMANLFSSLFSAMVPGARAVFQFYPENASQVELLMSQAVRAGFTGGLVIDYPNSTRAKKLFLCLFAGGRLQSLPSGLDGEVDICKAKKRKPLKNSKEWVLAKKQRWRRKGRDVRPDSKYTGRKRSSRF